MNSTPNGSRCYVSQNTTAQKVGETLAYCVVFVVSLIGNPIIAFTVYKTKTMRKPINYFIVNMAMSDLLFPIFLIPRDIAGLHSDGAWLITGPVGQALCKLVPFLAYVSTVVSISSMVLIAVDRFGAVLFPLRSPLISSKLCPYFILTTWIVAMAGLSSNLFALELVENHGHAVCTDRLAAESYRFTVAAVVCFYLPIVALVILYTIIIVKLKTQVIPGERSVNAEELRTRRNRHVLKMAIAIVLAFTLCWLPWSIFRFLRYFTLENECSSSIYRYGRIANFMAILNCAINPCICFIFSENYRQGLKRISNVFGLF